MPIANIMKQLKSKSQKLSRDFPVHYAALFISRTINNNYMTLLIALHHTHDGFRYFVQMLQEQHSFLVFVSNYYSYKEKTIKLLPYHSFYGGHILPREIKRPFLAVRLKKIQSYQDAHLAAFPQQHTPTSSVMKLETFHIKHAWLLLLLCRI